MTGRPVLVRTRHPRVRVYQQVRTAHLERAHEFVPATILFGSRRYDYDESLTPGLDLHRTGLVRTAMAIVRSDCRVVEVNEPAMRSGLLRAAIAVVAARGGARLRGRSPLVVTYAIENQSEFEAPARTVRSHVRARVDRALAGVVARGVDRIAYGTGGAQQEYARVFGAALRGARSALLPALPAACDCTESARSVDASARTRAVGPQVLFLGALSPRKGLPQLLEAWPLVASRCPTATLRMIGIGDLRRAAEQFAVARPEVSVQIDPPRQTVHQALREAGVLVLLSQPSAHWREQVGLPIVEGLAHGCTVVTTDQTGLAAWLTEHGHAVLPVDADAVAISQALVAAITDARSSASVLGDLPATDGRRAADEWLMGRAGAAS